MTAPGVELPALGHSDEVVRLVARFEDCTLPKAEWTHRAHLAVALWYASRLPAGEALAAIRRGIHRLNAAHGVVATQTGGYHETITRAYMQLVGRFVDEDDADGGWQSRVDRLLERLGERDLLLAWYSRERLMSPAARAGWVEPDLAPLP
jgi:hypothetical protein